MPTIECPATEVFCPPQSGGGGFTLPGPQDKQEFSGVIAAGAEDVPVMSWETEPGTNQVLMIQGYIHSTLDDDGSDPNDSTFILLSAMLSRDSEGVIEGVNGDAEGFDPQDGLELDLEIEGDEIIFTASNSAATAIQLGLVFTLTIHQLPFDFDIGGG